MKLKNKRTGEINELKVAVNGDLAITKGDEIIGIYSSLTELDKDWEDVPEEPKDYWWISPVDTDVVHCVEDVKDEMDQYNKEIGNYFETKEEAEKAVEKLKAWKRLKDKGFRFTNWEFRDVLDGELVIEAKLNFDNDSNIQRDLEICFGGEE